MTSSAAIDRERTAPRDPHSVPCTLVADETALADLGQALAAAVNVAIDTEVPISGPKARELRVMSVATRDASGAERAFVVDARDLDPTLLAPVLVGVVADAWNANFDANVIDRAVWSTTDTTTGLRWWDGQLADALLHQGRSGFGWYHGLAWATEHYLGIEAEGKGTVQLSYTAYDDLSADQVAYAAADAVETLWVCDALRREVNAAGLSVICDIENEARPFLDRMQRSGLPFDAEGWSHELDKIRDAHRQTLGDLADLTGGGQGTLFDSVVEPSWNPASDRQVRAALNQWTPDDVRRYTERRFGHPRDLTDGDSVTATVLGDIGGPLARTLLEFRAHAKILTTYGESIAEDHQHPDGRLRPQYLQVVGTNTGRLASRHPNAQNFTPKLKPHFRPSEPGRVFVHADLSQAELRYLAQVSDDEPLRRAFARGDDVHMSTASTMFRFDPDQLRSDDPERLTRLRQIAKALNFGIAYGQGASALADSLTRNGTPTTHDEGRELLKSYRETYPGTAAWADARDGEIRALRGEASRIDWDLTMRLVRSHRSIQELRREFRSVNGRWPNAREVADLQHPGTTPTPDQIDHVAWILGYSAPVALLSDGSAFTFSSRTVAGRRQQFNLHIERVLLDAAIEAATAGDSDATRVRRRFESDHGVVLHRPGRSIDRAELTHVFDDRVLRRRYIDALFADLSRDRVVNWLTTAAKERLSAMVPAWRNAPIQGGVADIMLAAYADLDDRLRQHPSALPVQTVHDSVVVECDEDAADAVAAEVRAALDAASLRFCPDVAPQADVDIRRSLSDSDIVRAV